MPRDCGALDDFVELSSGEKAVKRVSGVPLNESAAPLDEWGEVGLKGPSRLGGLALMLFPVDWDRVWFDTTLF